MKRLLAIVFACGCAFAGEARSQATARDWLEIGVEARLRSENRSNLLFDAQLDDATLLSRLRLNVAVRPSDRLRFVAQAQDARQAFYSERRSVSGVLNPFDLRIAYAEIDGESGGWRLRLGRQESAYGDERIFGQRRWSNISPTWDAAKLTLGGSANSVDLFSMALVRSDSQDLDEPFTGLRVHGAYGSLAGLLGNLQVEPYWFYIARPRTTVPASLAGDKLYLGGARLVDSGERAVGYEAEAAWQRSARADRPVRAWMANGRLEYRPNASAWLDRFHAMFEFASGDRDPHDGRSQTYDPINPARHRHLGRADVVGRRNVQAWTLGWEANPTQRLQLRFNHLQFRLASRRDALYLPNNVAFVRPPPDGFASAYVGGELDTILRYEPREFLSLEAGLLQFFPGDVVPSMFGRVRQTFFYLAAELKP